MPDVIISPNMNLPVPVASQAPGPDWAEDLVACLQAIDQHTHGPGQGVEITPSAILINSDLTFGNNNAIDLRTVRFTPQAAALALADDIGCLYEVNDDLYYNDGAGNQIRITQSGSVSGSAGTITGLPSGTASAAYSGGTFTFSSATNTPASMNVGPVSIGNSTVSPNQVTLYPNAAIASNYNMVLPSALPAATNYLTLDNSGNVLYNTAGATGTAAVVLATSPTLTTPTIASPSISNPTFTGTVSGRITSGLWTPTITWATSAATSVTAYGFYLQINNIVYATFEVAFTGGASGSTFSLASVPVSSAVASTTAWSGVYNFYNVNTTTSASAIVINGGANLISAQPSTPLFVNVGQVGRIGCCFSYSIA